MDAAGWLRVLGPLCHQEHEHLLQLVLLLLLPLLVNLHRRTAGGPLAKASEKSKGRNCVAAEPPKVT